jgi:uncharacterized membrane protein YbhN (UPF0104 family)
VSLKSAARLVIGLALFAGVLWWLGASWDEIRGRARLVPTGLGVSFVGTLLASVVTAGRWKLIAESMGGTSLRLRTYVHALVVTRLAGQFTSTMAMDLVGRGVVLRAGGSQRGVGHAATQVVVERIFDLLLPLALAAWVLLFRGDTAALGTAVLGFAIVGALAFRPLVGLALTVYGAIRARLGRPLPDDGEPPKGVEPRLGPIVSLLSIARFAAVVLQFWGVAWGVGLELGLIETTGGTVFAQLTGLLGVTPGGLGIIEIGWTGGLELVGLDPTGIALFVVAQRLMVISSFALLSAVGSLAGFGRPPAPAAEVAVD